MKKISLLFLSMFCLVQFSQAQLYGIGGQVSLISGWSNNIGLHGSGEYEISDKMSLTGSLGLFIPSTNSTEYRLYDRSNTNSPLSIDVPFDETTGGLQISLDAKRYFFTELGDDFGFYGTLGIGFLSFGVSGEFTEDIDPAFNSLVAEYEEKERYSNPTVNFGLGFELVVGRNDGVIFLEPRINVPSNQDSEGNAREVNIPSTLQVNLGFRKLL